MIKYMDDITHSNLHRFAWIAHRILYKTCGEIRNYLWRHGHDLTDDDVELMIDDFYSQILPREASYSGGYQLVDMAYHFEFWCRFKRGVTTEEITADFNKANHARIVLSEQDVYNIICDYGRMIYSIECISLSVEEFTQKLDTIMEDYE